MPAPGRAQVECSGFARKHCERQTMGELVDDLKVLRRPRACCEGQAEEESWQK